MIIALLIFLILTIVGIIILRSITEETRLFTIIPAAMLVGSSVYILLLNLNSKILHGQIGIIATTLEFILIGFFLFKRFKKSWVKFEEFDSRLKVMALSIFVLIVILSTFKMITQLPAADSSMQWAYAATFARGNYPIMAPWQPDLNPNYHLGAYFLEGAIYSLSGLQILTVHTLMNIFLLIAGSLLAIFAFFENKYSFKNIWLIFACLILYIPFGVIILFYPDLIQTSSVTTQISQLMTAIPAKGGAGASLVDLNSLSFLPARSLSLGLTLLSLYFIYSPFKNVRLKIAAFSLLLATIALVEESMFIPIFLAIVSVFILSFFSFLPKLEFLKQQQKTLFFILVLTSIIVVLQGGFISENISKNPLSNKESIYRLTLPFQDGAFEGKFHVFNNVNLDSESKLFDYFIPSPLLSIFILLIYSYFKNNTKLGIIAIFSILAFVSFLTAEYKYCGSCSIRIHSFGAIASGFGFMLLLFSIFKDLSLRKNLIGFAIFIPILIGPSLLPDLIAQNKKINEGIRDRVKNIIFSKESSSPQNQLINWANKNLPLNARIIVLEVGVPSPGNTLNFQYHGLYTTLGPQYIHVNRQEPGPEYFDLILTLNPSVFKQTKTEYLYIESDSPAYKQLPTFRKNDLSNSNYFQLLQSVEDNDKFFRVYKVLHRYLDKNVGGKEITDGTLSALDKQIPQEKSVYVADYGDVPMLSFWYRMALVLTLKDKDLRFNFSQTDYQIIETYIPHRMGSIAEKYDYYILAPDTQPPFPSQLIWSNLYAKGWKRD